MPGQILHTGISVTCSHAAQAKAVPTDTTVQIAGNPVLTTAAIWTVTGCSYVPSGGNGPCVSGTWTEPSTCVCVQGKPVVIISSSTCEPTGTPFIAFPAKPDVLAT